MSNDKRIFRLRVCFKEDVVEIRPEGRSARGTMYSLGAFELERAGLDQSRLEAGLERFILARAAR